MKHEEPKQSKHDKLTTERGKTHGLNPEQADERQVKLISTAPRERKQDKEGK